MKLALNGLRILGVTYWMKRKFLTLKLIIPTDKVILSFNIHEYNAKQQSPICFPTFLYERWQGRGDWEGFNVSCKIPSTWWVIKPEWQEISLGKSRHFSHHCIILSNIVAYISVLNDLPPWAFIFSCNPHIQLPWHIWTSFSSMPMHKLEGNNKCRLS